VIEILAPPAGVEPTTYRLGGGIPKRRKPLTGNGRESRTV